MFSSGLLSLQSMHCQDWTKGTLKPEPPVYLKRINMVLGCEFPLKLTH